MRYNNDPMMPDITATAEAAPAAPEELTAGAPSSDVEPATAGETTPEDAQPEGDKEEAPAEAAPEAAPESEGEDAA